VSSPGERKFWFGTGDVPRGHIRRARGKIPLVVGWATRRYHETAGNGSVDGGTEGLSKKVAWRTPTDLVWKRMLGLGGGGLKKRSSISEGPIPMIHADKIEGETSPK